MPSHATVIIDSNNLDDNALKKAFLRIYIPFFVFIFSKTYVLLFCNRIIVCFSQKDCQANIFTDLNVKL